MRYRTVKTNLVVGSFKQIDKHSHQEGAFLGENEETVRAFVEPEVSSMLRICEAVDKNVILFLSNEQKNLERDTHNM